MTGIFEWFNLWKQMPAKHVEKYLQKWKDQFFKTVKCYVAIYKKIFLEMDCDFL